MISSETTSLIIKDILVNETMIQNYNVILIGTPISNKWINTIMNNTNLENNTIGIKVKTPIIFNLENSTIKNISINGSNCVFNDIGIVFTFPKWNIQNKENTLNLIISGTSVQFMKDITKYSFSRFTFIP